MKIIKDDLDSISEDIILAVKRGAYWFDENHPDWARKINLDELDMAQCDRCIIGQAIGDYAIAITEMFSSFSIGNAWAMEHGFQRPDTKCYEESMYSDWDEYRAESEAFYIALETVWSDEVKKRLG